ncbi:MAG: ParB/RepB/Spo0J family partition protein [Clostridia bacterium]|nr:ParB/RepB/Spo0J family partition protein [Clostridia bacterium]
MNFLNQSKKLAYIRVEDITPAADQPRKIFDDYELEKLKESIKQCGVIQPLSVKATQGGYRLIAGERRLRAAKMAGLKKVPCIVFTVADETAAVIGIVENLQRSDLTLFEQAEGIQKIITQYGITHLDAAERLGIAQSTLSNKLRILKLNPSQRERIVAANLTERHARALIRLPEEIRDSVLNRIIAEEMSVQKSEELIEDILNPHTLSDKPHPTRKSSIGDIRIFANSLNRLVATLANVGLEAKQQKREGKDYIEYRIRIKKQVLIEEEESPQLKIC